MVFYVTMLILRVGLVGNFGCISLVGLLLFSALFFQLDKRDSELDAMTSLLKTTVVALKFDEKPVHDKVTFCSYRRRIDVETF